MPAAPLAGVGSASSVAQTIHGSSGYPFSLPADVHLDHRLVGAPSVVNRSKGVPLRVAGAFGRPTPLGFAISDSLRHTKRCSSFLVGRSWWFLPKWCLPPGPSIPRRSPNCQDAIHLSAPVQSPLRGRVGGARMRYHRLLV
uniref:Uncharacterized protein n=1 Tax=Triticum urartu TaxID=4572 RepID=A0A8R7PZM8_TRIUA